MVRQSPYASRYGDVDAPDALPEYVFPVTRDYAAPGLNEENGYNDEFGWGPKLRTLPGATPDPHRTKVEPTRDFRPDANRPPGEFWGQIDRDDARRHSVETQDADGWEERKGQYKVGRNPRENPPAETRRTERLAPSNYLFTRPFDQHSARELNGLHFSMADHRREYPILGMAPPRAKRNTYRTEPKPWDEDMTDSPQNIGGIVPVEIPPSGNRSWRL